MLKATFLALITLSSAKTSAKDELRIQKSVETMNHRHALKSNVTDETAAHLLNKRYFEVEKAKTC